MRALSLRVSMLLAALVVAPSAHAQSENEPYVRYPKRNSPVKFGEPSTPEMTRVIGSFVDGMFADGKELEKQIAKLPKPDIEVKVDLPSLPACALSRVRRKPVMSNSLESRAIDFVYYSPDDPTQRDRVLTFGSQAVAMLVNGSKTEIAPDERQRFAQFAGVECIPTRLWFVTDNGERFMEYREGSEAFR